MISMAEKSKGRTGEPGRAPRVRLPESRPDPPNWYAVYIFESSYSKPATAEDLELHSKASGKILASDLPEEKKKAALSYLKLGESCGRFSVVQTEAVASKYAEGKISDERLDFERRLMDAWCGKRLAAFADEESAAMDTREVPVEERKLAKRMLELAKSKSDIILAIAASTMKVYYPELPGKDRMDLLSKGMELVESARDRI